MAAARVTISGLADRLGLSKASVSYALNGQPGVSDETRARVLALADELGWHPSSSARALSRARSDAIGIVLRRDPSLLGAEPYYMSLLAGVEAELATTGQSLLLRMVGPDGGQDSAAYRRWSAERRVDGVMLFDIAVRDPRPALLDDLGIEFVVHGNRDDVAPGHVLLYDADEDARLLVEHVAGLGYRALLHVSGPDEFEHERERREAIARHARAHGIRVVAVSSDYSMEAGERLVGERLVGGRPAGAAAPFAVVTSNDLLALGAQEAVMRVARRDIAVASWDDSLLCRLGSRPITALDRFPEEQGRRATRMLLDRLQRSDAPALRARRSVLIPRATSVPAP